MDREARNRIFSPTGFQEGNVRQLRVWRGTKFVMYSSMQSIILSVVSKRSSKAMIPGCFTRKRMPTSFVSISGLFLTKLLSIILIAHLSCVSLLIPSFTVEKFPLESSKSKKEGKHAEKSKAKVCQCVCVRRGRRACKACSKRLAHHIR